MVEKKEQNTQKKMSCLLLTTHFPHSFSTFLPLSLTCVKLSAILLSYHRQEIFLYFLLFWTGFPAKPKKFTKTASTAMSIWSILFTSIMKDFTIKLVWCLPDIVYNVTTVNKYQFDIPRIPLWASLNPFKQQYKFLRKEY